MIRVFYITTVFTLIALPSHAQNFCGEAETDANTAISASLFEMSQGDSVQAIEYSKQAVELSETCFEAQLALVRAYYLRFDHVMEWRRLVSRADSANR